MFLHSSPAVRYVWGEPLHLDSDLCHQRARSDAVHEYRSSSFLWLRWSRGLHSTVAAIATTLFSSFMWLWEMEVFEGRDKAGVVTLSATASIFGYSHLKARNPALKRAEQKPGNSRNLCLITCDTEGHDSLASPEIKIHHSVCWKLHSVWFMSCSGLTIIRKGFASVFMYSYELASAKTAIKHCWLNLIWRTH